MWTLVVFQLMQVEMMNRKGTLKNILSIVTSLLFPIKMFWTSYKIQMYLQDPDKEHVECLADVKSGDLEPDEKAKRENLKQMEEFMLYKSRFSGHITEGFIESQAAIRVQVLKYKSVKSSSDQTMNLRILFSPIFYTNISQFLVGKKKQFLMGQKNIDL